MATLMEFMQVPFSLVGVMRCCSKKFGKRVRRRGARRSGGRRASRADAVSCMIGYRSPTTYSAIGRTGADLTTVEAGSTARGGPVGAVSSPKLVDNGNSSAVTPSLSTSTGWRYHRHVTSDRTRTAAGSWDDQQQRILDAAAKLLAEVGPTGISTRAVAAAAGVQTPTLYRLFKDKDGLLDSVASFGFETYLAEKRAFEPSENAVDDLRRGWDIHVEFGLTNPSIYALMYGNLRPGRRPAAAQENNHILRRMLERANAQGRLRVPVDAATRAIEASTTGAVLLLLAQPESRRDPRLIKPLRDTVLDSLTIEPTPGTDPQAITYARADALLAVLSPQSGVDPLTRDLFSPAEADLLREWLTRLVNAGG